MLSPGVSGEKPPSANHADIQTERKLVSRTSLQISPLTRH